MLNIDTKENPKATHNYILKNEEVITQEKMEELNNKIKEFTEEVDSIINISSVRDANPEITLRTLDIFDEYEKIRNVDIKSSILTSLIAAEYLSPNGYIAFSSTVDSLKGKNLALEQ